ncbi:hypothetical protein ACXM1Q_004290 [Streptococcus sp. 10F2]
MVENVADYLLETEDSREPNEQKDFVYLFCSFDIVNSTYLKSINSRWAELFNYFYDKSQNKLSEYGFEFWKYIGDEVLFYKKLNSEDLNTLYSIPYDLFKSMQAIQSYIHSEFQDTKMYIALKGTLWISKVLETNLDDLTNFETVNKNIQIKKIPNLTYSEYPYEFIDFLGPDIDLGFRISKLAIRNQLLVSAEFVQIQNILSRSPHSIPEAKAYLSHYRSIGNKQLKGIWHERDYPLIMYHPNWSEDVFEYDEKNYSLENLKEDVANYLDRVFKSLGKYEELSEYVVTIKSTIQDKKKVTKIESPVDIHIAAIIFNSQKQVLLLKRGYKKSSPDKFDFGCINLVNGQTIEQTLNEYYDFGSDSHLQLRKNKSTNKPIPIAIYEYERSSGNTINGLLFTGVLSFKNVPKSFRDYECCEFINIDVLKEYELFDDSEENIKIAFEANFGSA